MLNFKHQINVSLVSIIQSDLWAANIWQWKLFLYMAEMDGGDWKLERVMPFIQKLLNNASS
jgi:hypothetical protein